MESKGFKRSSKEWEKSIAGHIGRFIDRLQPRDIMDIILIGGISYAGFKSFGDNPWGVLFGLTSYKLALSESEAAGIAGVAGLAAIGLNIGAGALQRGLWNLAGAVYGPAFKPAEGETEWKPRLRIR